MLGRMCRSSHPASCCLAQVCRCMLDSSGAYGVSLLEVLTIYIFGQYYVNNLLNICQWPSESSRRFVMYRSSRTVRLHLAYIDAYWSVN